jgi:molybdate transport system permease protein
MASSPLSLNSKVDSFRDLAGRRQRRVRLPSLAGLRPGRWWWLLSLPILGFLTLPLLALLLRVPLDRLWVTLSTPAVYQAISLSLTTSAITTGVTILSGTPLAYLMARRQFPLKRVVDTLIDLPTVLPPAVAGVALLMAFGRRGMVGSYLEAWGLHIAFTQAAVVMAQTFVAAPLYLKSAIAGLAEVQPELEQAAALDGAGDWQVFRRITLPLARRALLTGVVMTWARALGEFGATIIFAGNFPGRTQTMPLAIYLGFELDLSVALTLSLLLMGCSFLTLILVKNFFQRP